MTLRNLIACVTVACTSSLISLPSHAAPTPLPPGSEIDLSPEVLAAVAFGMTKREAERKVGEMVPVCELAFESCWGATGATHTPEAKRTIVRNAKRALTAERNRIRGEFLGILEEGKSRMQRSAAGRAYLDDLESVKRAGLRKINSTFEHTLRQLDGLAR